MGFHIDDSELAEAAKSGEKVRGIPAAPAKPTEIAQLLQELRNLGGNIVSVMRKPHPMQPAPIVRVEAPQVHVSPQLKAAPAPRKWKMEVTERDNTPEHRIKTITMEAVE